MSSSGEEDSDNSLEELIAQKRRILAALESAERQNETNGFQNDSEEDDDDSDALSDWDKMDNGSLSPTGCSNPAKNFMNIPEKMSPIKFSIGPPPSKRSKAESPAMEESPAPPAAPPPPPPPPPPPEIMQDETSPVVSPPSRLNMSGDCDRSRGLEDTDTVWLEGAASAGPVQNGVGIDESGLDLSEMSDSDSELDVDKILEEGLSRNAASQSNGLEGYGENNRHEYIKRPQCREKVVLRSRGAEYFEVLPDGWIEITHRSGLPVFLHKESRVCTFSRPYFIGPGSARNHDVPVSAIPCLQQKRVRENREEQETESRAHASSACPDNPLAKLQAPAVKVQTSNDFKDRNLTSNQLHEYALKGFEFETVKVQRFNNWSDTRKFQRKVREEAQLAASTAAGHFGRPTLPSNVKLITVPSMEKGVRPQQRAFYLNPDNKTSIAVLHEYIQKVLKGSVEYNYGETRNAAHPYSATVKVKRAQRHHESMEDILRVLPAISVQDPDWVCLGTGYGNSKKAAKLDGARKALQVLVPEIGFGEECTASSDVTQRDTLELFDMIPITDSRIQELSMKTNQPAPYLVLQACLNRYSAFGDTRQQHEMVRLGHQAHVYILSVGKHKVKVSCTNKKDGKQKAAQHMLAKLYPAIKYWGQLLRLYGSDVQRRLQETKKEKDSIIKLQGSAKGQPATSEPNHAILDKLRQEMAKLHPAQATASPVQQQIVAGSLQDIDI